MVAFYNHDHYPMFIISFPKPATPFAMGPVAGPGRAIRAGHVEDLVTTFQDCASAAKLPVWVALPMRILWT